jgi:hypothetical protein
MVQGQRSRTKWSRFRAYDLGFRVQGSGFRIQDLGFGGLGCRVKGYGERCIIQGLGFRL